MSNTRNLGELLQSDGGVCPVGGSWTIFGMSPQGDGLQYVENGLTTPLVFDPRTSVNFPFL